MTSISTTLSDRELTDLGRAMERAGFTTAEDYFRWAVNQQTQELLSGEEQV